MINKPKVLKRVGHRSIAEAMLVALCLALVLGVLVGLVLKFGADFLVQANYLSKSKIAQREEERVADLQEYVTHYRLNFTDKKLIDEWVKSDNYLYMLFYRNGELEFEAGNFYVNNRLSSIRVKESKIIHDNSSDDKNLHAYSASLLVELPTRDELFNYADKNRPHTIKFADGEVTVRVAEYSEYMYYALGNFFSILGSITMFLTFLIVRIHAISARIRKLGNDVISVAAGDIEHEIAVDGNDEVAKLSSNVDNMRQSLVFSYKKQKDAQQANAELITAMSHDIRTPLTVLLGYIDMMKMKNGDEELADYIQASEHTALRLKRMSDDMFNYFRLFGDTEMKLELEVYPVATLISQLLEEHIFMLTERGYEIRSNIEILNTVQGIEVKTDAPHLARVVENLFSNIYKYADKTVPVCIWLDINNENCKLTFTNGVAKNLENVESNKIGLKTCTKIANTLDIDFNVKSEDDVFTAEIVIPTYVEEVPLPQETEEKRGVRARLALALRSVGGFFVKAAGWLKSKLASLFRRKKNDQL